MSYNILVRKESSDMGDELCPAGRAVAQPTSALFHGDAVFLHEQCGKFLEGGGLVQHSVDLLSQLVQLGLVDGLGGLLPFGGKFGVGMVETALSAPLRPILALRNMCVFRFRGVSLRFSRACVFGLFISVIFDLL